MIRVREYRNYSMVFVQSLRSIRVLVRPFCGPYEHLMPARRRPQSARNLLSTLRDGYILNQAQNTSSTSAERGSLNEDNSRTSADGELGDINTNNTPLINACLYLARRQMSQDQSDSNTATSSEQNIQARNRASTLINLYLRRRHLARESSNSNQNSENSPSQSEDRIRRIYPRELLNNSYSTPVRNRNQNQSTTNQNPGTSRPSNFNPYRDMALITSRSADFSSTQNNHPDGSNQNSEQGNQNIPRRRTTVFSDPEPNTSGASVNPNSEQDPRQRERDGSTERQVFHF